MSASSSNLIPKMDNPKFKNIVDFVKAQSPDSKFSFDGVRGSARSKLCKHVDHAGTQMECVDIALEGEQSFSPGKAALATLY
jgi:hypothetical protein